MVAVSRATMTVAFSDEGAARRPLLQEEPAASHESARVGFAAMARTHQDALLAFATRLTRNPADARDLVQDSLERAFRRADTFTVGTNGRAWLFSILHHTFIDRSRRQKAEPRSESVDDVEVPANEPGEAPAWTAITAETLASAVASLEEEFRSVYDLHAREGLSYQQIAERLGIPSNTVGTRLIRARRKLRALLEVAKDGGER
jgi:RNA polymerase sigma-70 factor (ECF subfamily)